MDFLTSLGIILLSALLLGSICKLIKMPSLLGMLIVGIVLGPYLLNLISDNILAISADLRQLALVIILTRAGLSLNLSDLRKNGRCSILMCFVPAVFEIGGYLIFGSCILHLNIIEAGILGTVMAAVSPAVVVPRMLKIREQGYGVKKGIPQMIVAGASADDVFVIILFTAFIGMAAGGGFSYDVLWRVPVSIILGIGIGAIAGYLFAVIFKKFHMRDSVKVIFMLSFSFLFIALQNAIEKWVPFSGLLAIIAMGALLYRKHEPCAARLSQKYTKLWIVAEILLFVLVGATVDLKYAIASGGAVVAVIGLALIFRMAGVYFCLLGSKLNLKERGFCVIAYTPKATVQAAIGSVPLAMGLACGPLVLTAAVLAILITAPLGALATDLSYKYLLTLDCPLAESRQTSKSGTV